MSLNLPVGAVLVGMIGVGCCQGQTAGASSASSYVPATLEMGSLVLFPRPAKDYTVPLPPGLTGTFNYRATSPDGRSLFGVAPREDYGGLKKVEFNPVRLTVVPGSAGLGYITSITVSPTTGRIFVAASTLSDGKPQCGDFEIDPLGGSFRALRLGTAPGCEGPVSPDGTLGLHSDGDRLSVLNLATGASTPLGIGLKEAIWSPDGRWIAAVLEKSGQRTALLIDASNPSKRRRLGVAQSAMIWSPDSRYLLLQKSQISCWPTLYGTSLEVIDISARKRSLVKSSHCKILSGFFWVDSDAVQ